MILAVMALAAAQVETPVNVRTEARDCAVLGVVAREHLKLGEYTGPPLLPEGDYLPVCPWTKLGLKPFAAASDRSNYWLRFGRPEYAGSSATVEVGAMYASRSGEGSRCRLRRVGGKWKLIECGRTWVS